jgi:ABC-2 type transport system permease protein
MDGIMMRTSPRSLREWGTYYRRLWSIGIAQYTAYRGAAAIWTLGLIVGPLVTLVVWTTVADSNGGEAGGFTAPEYAAYFVILMVVNHLTFTWQAWEQEFRIRTGQYSPLLLRPVHPIHADVTGNFSFKLFGLVGVVPAAVILSFAFDARYEATAWAWLAFLPTLLLAMVLRYMLEWTSGLIAFWVTKTSAMLGMYSTAMFFLSGQVAPLTIFPEPVQAVAFVLPFRWMVFFPVEVALGDASGRDIALGLIMQLAWIGITLILFRLLWSRAVVRYSAVGA